MATRKTPAKTAGKTAGKPAGTARKRDETVAPGRRAKTAAKATPASATAAPAARRKAARTTKQTISAEERYRAIAHAAYLRAEKRGFAPGNEIDDWLAAEAEFDAACRSASE